MKKPYNPATEKPYFIDEEGARNFDYEKNDLLFATHRSAEIWEEFPHRERRPANYFQVVDLLHQVRRPV